jgi:hypothetical protein
MEELLISFTISLASQREAVRGLRGTFSAGLCVLLKPEKCHQFLPGPMHAYPRHDPWKRLRTAKPCKGETRVPDAITRTNQLWETTPTEYPRSSKAAGVEHKASNLVLKKSKRYKILDKEMPYLPYLITNKRGLLHGDRNLYKGFLQAVCSVLN